MRVAVDVRSVQKSAAGIGQYTRNLVNALASLPDGPELLMFGDANTDESKLPESRLVRLPRGLLWHEYARIMFRRLGAAVYHSPSSAVVPMVVRNKSVVTVHDLVPLIFPETSTLRTRLGFRVLRHALNRTGAIIAVSENTKADLERLWSPRAPITVVHEAARPLPEPAKRDALGITGEFILAVGTIEPRKNLHTLLAAYERARGLPTLVIVGPSGWGDAPASVAAAAARVGDRVKLLGFVDDAVLAGLYRNARAFIAPSLYEGFGLPPLEAMSAGTPVAAAASGAAPEVLGEAAAYFEPESVEQLVVLLEQLTTDEVARDALIAKGLERAASFSWARAARETAAIYESL